MSSRLMSLLIWAAVAASAVYLGLRLFVTPTPVPGQAQLAGLGTAAAGDLTRLLGAPPVQPVAVIAAPVQDSRFKLLGVVAARGAGDGGLALISVDGKPARAVAVDGEVEPGLRVLSVSHRQAELGAARGTPGLILALPALPEASRGRLGDQPAGQAVGMSPPMAPQSDPGSGGPRNYPAAVGSVGDAANARPFSYPSTGGPGNYPATGGPRGNYPTTGGLRGNYPTTGGPRNMPGMMAVPPMPQQLPQVQMAEPPADAPADGGNPVTQ
jgi:general secretion pathway protein C